MNIKPNVSACVFCIYILCIFSGCTRSQASSLFLHIENGTAASAPLKLKALTEAARSAVIDNPDRAPYMYFLFDDTAFPKQHDVHSLIASGGYALELEFETFSLSGKNTDAGTQSQVHEGHFFCGLVYEKNLSKDPVRLRASETHSLDELKGVRAALSAGTHFKVALGFESAETAQDSDVRGFMVYSEVPLTVKSAAVKKARYGWSRTGGLSWFGFSADGGTIDAALLRSQGETAVPGKISFSRFPVSGTTETQELHILFRPDASDTGSADNQNEVEVLYGSEKMRIRRSPSVHSAVIDMRSFIQPAQTVQLVGNAHMVEGVILERKEIPSLAPITADPGLIIDWPQTNWRNRQFELFSWQQFPSVLIFDCADYRVQDAFFKRLGFYVEKKGYTGTLFPDEKIKKIHGFNAHDYRAESLAAFFDQAEKEKFALNENELLLRDILFANKVIVRTPVGIGMGEGAVLSISRESPHYLRLRFMAHEGLHGIYFVQESFRNAVDQVFSATDPRAVEFLRRFFEVNPSLNYDTADSYLFKNEFMAYIAQQKPEYVQEYYTNVLVRFMRGTEAGLCNYVRKTGARDFVQAAEILSDFLYENWGLRGGRVFLITVE